MPKTVVTSASSYLTNEAFLDFVSEAQVGDLLANDADVPPVRLTRAEIIASTVLTTILQAASGEVEQACFVGEKYAPADLEGLTGNALAALQKLVADRGMWMLLTKKWPGMEETDAAKKSEQLLLMLRAGERIFGLQENMDAGKPKSQFRQPSEVERANLNTNIARPFFGRRSSSFRR